MNPFKTLASAIDPLEAVGTILSKVFPSDEDLLKAQAVLEKIKNHPAALQVSLNKKESQHTSLFVAGWRPFIGWVCGLGLANTFIINPLLQWFCGITGPQMPLDVMIELVIAMLGLGTLRTVEKFGGKAK